MKVTCHYTHTDNRIGELCLDGFPEGTAGPIGNALRRTLLSEIEGTAVTAVGIAGTRHTFDAVDGVKEDVQEIIANLRKLELKLTVPGKKVLTLDTQRRQVTAFDIHTDPDVHILNPQLPIATLNPGAKLQLQMEVQKGRGFQRVSELRSTEDAISMTQVPADFSPVKKVGYRVQNSGEGREYLVLQVITNGTISPLDAAMQATDILAGNLKDVIPVGEYDPNGDRFPLPDGVIRLLSHALRRELLSCRDAEGSPVLTVESSDSEIVIGTDGTLTPNDALTASLSRLADKFAAVRDALKDPRCKQERGPQSEPAPQKGPIVFGDLRFVDETPDLLAIQCDSYRDFIERGILEILSEFFPIKDDRDQIRIELQGHRLKPLADANTCFKRGRTYAASLVLSLRLNDVEQKKTQDFEVEVCKLPLMTEDGTFIIQGVKRVGVGQLHRSPGAIFERDSKKGMLSARIIPYRGAWVEFETSDDGEQPGCLYVRLDRRERLPATALLRTFGAETNDAILGLFSQTEDDEKVLIRNTLREDVTSGREEAILEIYRRLQPDDTPDIESATYRVTKMLSDSARYDLSKVGRYQLNRKLGLSVSVEERLLTIEDIVAVMKRLMAIYCGKAETDDLASLTERRVRSIGELMQNQLRLGFYRMARHARERLNLQEESLSPEERIDPQFVTESLHDFWSGSQLSQVIQQTNPLDELTHKRRLSDLGPGGLHRDRAPFEIRDLHETHYGRICPMETPEGPSVGLITTLANHARVNEYGFIEFANERMGESRTTHPQQILGLSSSLIPFIEYDDPKRVLMGANMQRQAVPLMSTELPLVQAGMEARVAQNSRAMAHAHVSGQVVKATADEIIIRAHDGSLTTYHLSRHERSNNGTSITQKPTVSVEQMVETGTPIADGPAMKDGVLSLGRNVLVAYMPWEGYNTEDGIVISDRLVREEIFTSVHIEKIRVEARHTEAGVEHLTAHLPGKPEEDMDHLDAHGIAKVGTEIRPADILVGKLSPRIVDEPRLADLLQEESMHYVNTSKFVPPYIEGQVIRTQYLSRRNGDDLPADVEEIAVVEIAIRRDVQVGDKFANRHGNKGVVARIVPEADMPHLADGTPVDVILSPLKLQERQNYGEILETHLGWAAHQLGQTIVCPPYDGPDDKLIGELLARAGLPESGRTTLFDGRTGRAYDGEVIVGYQYLMKLYHLVEDKIHARSIGPYSIITQQPLGGKAQFGGQRLGEMEVWALEAYGAAHTLYEMLTAKSNATSGLLLYKRIANQGKQALLNTRPSTLGIQQTPIFKLLTSCLRGLGIDLTQDEQGVHIRLASPDRIREWSQGEISLEVPDHGDLPESSLIELPDANAMGHVDLAVPVSHIWFFKGLPGPIGLLLDLMPRDLESVLYYEKYIVLDATSDVPQIGQVLTEEEYGVLREKHDFRAGIGGTAIRELLKQLDLEKMAEELTLAIEETEEPSSREKLRKRLRRIHELLKSGVRPEWLMMTVLPVVPRSIRPTIPISNDGIHEDGIHESMLATSDLNFLYRTVIYRNSRLKRLIELDAPEAVIHNEARMLQQAVDALLDNGRHGAVVRDEAGRLLQSLADILKGKPGLLRSNLLGTRVDYSGRSVIVPGPELKMDECGLPREMALRLFEPFLIHELITSGHAANIRVAKQLIDGNCPEATVMLDKIVQDRFVLLNRAPTLHRGALQAFRPVLIDEKAIRIHPLVCRAFNADFDGDQMAVHVPLMDEAQQEAREQMLSHKNLLSPANGCLLAQPVPEVVLGCHYLTLSRDEATQGTIVSMSPAEVTRAYELDEIGLHDRIVVKWDGEEIDTTVGRVLFNGLLEDAHPYVNEPLDRDRLFGIIESVRTEHGEARAIAFLEQVAQIGFRFATRMGTTNGQMDKISPFSPEEHFNAARASRKVLADTVSKVTSSGYLSRKLATVAAGVLVTEANCNTEKTRNPVTCETAYGVCAKCYGTDLATGGPIQIGMPVGMIAVSAFGEHAYRLPIGSLHRLSALLEARREATLQVEGREYQLPELLAERGREVLHEYLLKALRNIYLEQEMRVDPKHFEIIIRQMLSQVKILDPGDTSFFAEDQVSRTRLLEENAAVTANGGQPATYESQILGITKIALASDSFLSAATFQQTTNILANAAFCGATDPLRGLHERVIAGRLIPVSV